MDQVGQEGQEGRREGRQEDHREGRQEGHQEQADQMCRIREFLQISRWILMRKTDSMEKERKNLQDTSESSSSRMMSISGSHSWREC